MKSKGYSRKKKAEIIAFYISNGKNATRTAKAYKMSKTTLYNWLKEDDGKDIEETITETIAEVITTVRESNTELLVDVFRVKVLAVRRLEELLPKEKDIFKVAAAIKVLNEVSGESEQENPIINFHQNIIKTLKDKGYGTQRSITEGDK